jgi:hypothetical protein
MEAYFIYWGELSSGAGKKMHAIACLQKSVIFPSVTLV